MLSLIGIVGTAISAYMIGRPPRHPRRRDPTHARVAAELPDELTSSARSATRSGGRHEFGFELRLWIGCVIALSAMKTKVTTSDEAGMHLEILPVSLGPELACERDLEGIVANGRRVPTSVTAAERG